MYNDLMAEYPDLKAAYDVLNVSATNWSNYKTQFNRVKNPPSIEDEKHLEYLDTTVQEAHTNFRFILKLVQDY